MKLTFLSAARSSWGAEQSLQTLAQALQRQGHVVTLICFDADLATTWREQGLGEGTLLERSGGSRLGDIVTMWRALRNCESTDAFVLFSYHLLPVGLLSRLDRSGGCRVIVHDLHDYLTAERGRRLLRFFSRFVDLTIAVSDFNRGIVGARKSVALYRPVERPVQRYRPPKVQGSRTVGVVGRLTPSKRHELVLQAIARLSAPRPKLLIRGSAGEDAAYIDRLSEQLRRSGIEYSVEGRRAWGEALADVDILVVANDAEPMGRTVAEAQLGGIPVIVPDAGGSSELVEHGRTGMTFVSGSSSSLAEGIASLLANSDLVELLVLEAQRQATERHDPDRYAQRYVAAIQTATEGRDRPCVRPEKLV